MILGFDVEVHTFPTEDGQHWSQIAPLGITCAALSSADGEQGMLWYSSPTRKIMSKTACESMARHIAHLVKQGHEIVTWNGMGFDWPVIAHEIGNFKLMTEIALNTIDPMYGMFKSFGFPISLDSASVGMGFEGKLEGMSGDKAVAMWLNPLTRPRVLSYVLQDARTTAQVAGKLKATREMHWIKKSGGPASRMLSYERNKEFVSLAMPDQSWMDKPIPENQFFDWQCHARSKPNPDRWPFQS